MCQKVDVFPQSTVTFLCGAPTSIVDASVSNDAASATRVEASVAGFGATSRTSDRWFVVVLTVFVLPLIVAVLTDAALTWDGAFYLFRTLDTGSPHIAHDRLIDGPIHWPVLWVSAFTDSLAVLRATFGIVHVVTPLVALGLSWWVVREDAPALIVWPILGIGLASLPGQINFISEGIKATQLMWPVLLAVLVGLPTRTIPLAALGSLVIMYLHPAAVPILAAVAAAAFVTGRLRPDARGRLYPLAGCAAVAALLRYGMIADRYQTGEMNVETFSRQWSSSATGLPGVALVLTLTVAVLLLAAALMPSVPRWLTVAPPALVALTGAVLTVWATEPTRWWDALEFRGPATLVALTAAGFAALDAFLATGMRRGRLRVLSGMRRWTGLAIGVVFAVVLTVQCVNYGRTIDGMNAALAASPEHCLPIDTLPGMPETPLNLWSTAALSLLYQGWTPSKVVLPDGGCEFARENGTLPIESPGEAYRSDRIDLVPLQWELGGHGACWWDERSGWHFVERTEIGRRRWSAGTGEIRSSSGSRRTSRSSARSPHCGCRTRSR